MKWFFLCCFATLNLFSSEKESEIDKISESLGHLIGKNIETIGLELDLDLIIKGIKDASKGKESPMNKSQWIEALSIEQENAYKEKASSNLKIAETFLESNAEKEGVVSLEGGKLQYTIEKKGKGESVQPHFRPIVSYVARYLDGSIFGESCNDQPIVLDETIPGLARGLIGMKEGEKRRLFLHPDLCDELQAFSLPSALIEFQVELIKANSLPGEETDSLIIESDSKQKALGLDTPQVR